VQISRSFTSCLSACRDFWVNRSFCFSLDLTYSSSPFPVKAFWCRKWSAKNQCRLSIWNQRGLLPYLAKSIQIIASENIIACNTRGVLTHPKLNQIIVWDEWGHNSSVWNHGSVANMHMQINWGWIHLLCSQRQCVLMKLASGSLSAEIGLIT